MEKPEQTTSCSKCGFIAHLSSYDPNRKTATYLCERCGEVLKKAY